MLLCCSSESGNIVGFAEIDAVQATDITNAAPRPYMCNLAVDRYHQRKGIAKALIASCEERCIQWGESCLHLKVREENNAALQLYKKLGYFVISMIQQKNQANKEEVVYILKKNLGKDR